MAALPAPSSDCLGSPEYDSRAAKTPASLDSSSHRHERTQHRKQGDESIACCWFDRDALASLGLSVPSDLELWRLRLRFGLPTRVALGARFRIAVDLVDEMGQPLSPSELLGFARSLRPPLIRLSPLQDDKHPKDNGRVESSLALRLVETPTKTPTKWVYDAVIERDEAASSTTIATACRILVALDSESDVAASNSAFHRKFREFCAHSTWLSERVLVLPFQSDRIQVGSTTERSAQSRPATTICRRLFSVPLAAQTAEPDTSERSRLLLAITENYGDAMGAHVWDASILLSFALIEAAPRLHGHPVTMMELGAGCGFFACVFRAMYSTESSAMILTERPESAMLLQSNVAQNEGVSTTAISPVEVLPLVWGQLPLPPAIATRVASSPDDAIGLVFAADVLYYWDAHAALLSTLKSLSPPSDQDTGFQVIIAHKHRGVAISRALEDVLARCGRCQNGAIATKERDGGEVDAWRGWCVERLARLGKVDLLRLTQKW